MRLVPWLPWLRPSRFWCSFSVTVGILVLTLTMLGTPIAPLKSTLLLSVAVVVALPGRLCCVAEGQREADAGLCGGAGQMPRRAEAAAPPREARGRLAPVAPLGREAALKVVERQGRNNVDRSIERGKLRLVEFWQ